MIGNRSDARKALDLFREGTSEDAFSIEGSTRTVYLINGVIYKVEFEDDTNVIEYNAMVKGSDSLPTGVFYPQVSLYRVLGNDIIAMEYIEGEAIYSCWCEVTKEICDSMCMTPAERDIFDGIMNDSNGRNVIRNENGYYIIDAA